MPCNTNEKKSEIRGTSIKFAAAQEALLLLLKHLQKIKYLKALKMSIWINMKKICLSMQFSHYKIINI